MARWLILAFLMASLAGCSMATSLVVANRTDRPVHVRAEFIPSEADERAGLFEGDLAPLESRPILEGVAFPDGRLNILIDKHRTEQVPVTESQGGVVEYAIHEDALTIERVRDQEKDFAKTASASLIIAPCTFIILFGVLGFWRRHHSKRAAES